MQEEKSKKIRRHFWTLNLEVSKQISSYSMEILLSQ